MSVTAVPATRRPPIRPPILRLALTELRLFARERARFVARLGLPIVLLVIFGSIPFYTQTRRSLDGHSLFDAYVPILIAYSLTIIALTALPMVLADYRDKGVLRRLQTTPAGAGRVIGAQLLAYLAVVAITVVLIVGVARIGYGVFLPRQPVGFILAALLAAAALICVGLFIAAVSPTAQAAQAIGTVLFFPLMFFAGLFFPIPVMPSFLRHLSHATPLGAAVQALQDAWLGHWPHPLQLITMAAYLAVFGLAAAKLFRWK
ncbi:MAG: ABC transporter permease [Streptosporangiaceae bacterium]